MVTAMTFSQPMELVTLTAYTPPRNVSARRPPLATAPTLVPSTGDVDTFWPSNHSIV